VWQASKECGKLISGRDWGGRLVERAALEIREPVGPGRRVEGLTYYERPVGEPEDFFANEGISGPSFPRRTEEPECGGP